ncbi:MAG: FAD-linked oxidase C-terminal domain-containing protein, partial [Pseudomonadota bacterium]
MATISIRRQREAAPELARKLAANVEGEVRFGAFDRGRYATDASIYQIMPIGVVIPRTIADVDATLEIAREACVSVTARGGGTSQAGQTAGAGLIIDTSKYLHGVEPVEGGSVWVEPGIVLDALNRRLKPNGLMFPVDISTGSQATLGGMTANNSCGSRSLRYGVMVDNVEAIDAILADGTHASFGIEGHNERPVPAGLTQAVREIVTREAAEIQAKFPKTARQVGGYNLDRLSPANPDLTKLLIGSEGTLAFFKRIKLKLTAPPRHKVLGVCHFPDFRQAMDSAQHIVKLGPTAVELVDRSILDLARAIPAFRSLLPTFVRGEPDALLLVEFAGDDLESERTGLRQLGELMGELGLPGSVVEAEAPAFQSDIWELRKAGLNIAMSMKGDGKPVSFIEDCAVPLEHLADYTSQLNDVFALHGTQGTWYAHASVGCLHVRPIINLKLEAGAQTMRAIAEEAMALVRQYKGAHSGEHGDGLVRTEFHEPMFGARIVRAFEEVKRAFDPDGWLNPGKIVHGTKMDDRSLFRYAPDYAATAPDRGLNWSAWGGFLEAAEMCNNNGACRKLAGGVMCPSYRATRDERDSVRGRANSLRLALSGQLGDDALTDAAMAETL